jgi:outer membrane biosynthesis protein TonB
MFTQLTPVTVRRQRWLRWGSLAFHGLLVAWLLHAPEPMRLQPNSLALGKNGKSLTRLYWASKSPDESTQSSPDSAKQRYSRQRLAHEKVIFKAPAQLAKAANPASHVEAEDNSKTQTLSALGHGAQAGVSYGSMYRGSLIGDEVRPALPSATSDPIVYPWQLPTSPGNEVIEITIDERGEIVNKTVLQSLGADIDTKCLAALENWHFHPATRNGTPIPSKQDAIFPFHARG